MERMDRLREVLREARQEVHECQEAVKRCEAHIASGAVIDDAFMNLMNTYRYGISDGEEAIAMWSEMLERERATAKVTPRATFA